MKPVSDPSLIARILEQDRRTHIYGLADLEEPFWSHSTWFQRGDAVVARVSLGDDWSAGYAMSRTAPEATLGLLGDVQHVLDDDAWITGPPGITEHLALHRPVRGMGPHLRMVLDDPDRVAPDPRVTVLDHTDGSAISELGDTDPDAAFFMESMLEHGRWVGIRSGDGLVAVAGTHTLSHRFGVAAIGGVLTRPDQRGRGLGRAVTSTLAHTLAAEIPTIGLNVAANNAGAVHLYQSLGFSIHLEYEEAQLGPG